MLAGVLCFQCDVIFASVLIVQSGITDVLNLVLANLVQNDHTHLESFTQDMLLQPRLATRANDSRGADMKNALRAVLELDGPEIVATFEDGRIIRHDDALTLAALLWAAGIRADDVLAIDWHDESQRALSGGQKVAIFSYLRRQLIIQDGARPH